MLYFTVLCGKGTSYDASTKTCKRCPVGSYRNVLTNVVSACTTCPSSRTTPTVGATDASYCISKKYIHVFVKLNAIVRSFTKHIQIQVAYSTPFSFHFSRNITLAVSLISRVRMNKKKEKSWNLYQTTILNNYIVFIW